MAKIGLRSSSLISGYPGSLKLNTDKARAKAIREGHPGTGMFPDKTMTNKELTDTLAYLSLLRREGSSGGK